MSSRRRTIGFTLLALGVIFAGTAVILGFVRGAADGQACPPVFAGVPASVCTEYVDLMAGRIAALAIAAVVLLVVGAQLASKRSLPSELQWRIPAYGEDAPERPAPSGFARGWYPDAHTPGRLRFFDGTIWTDDTIEG